MRFTETQVEILLELSNMEGLSNKQLTEKLGKKKTNMSKSLGELEEFGAILKGKQRKSREGKKYTEIPYYISIRQSVDSEIEIQFFEQVIEKLRDMDKRDSVLKLLSSNYTNKLIEKFKFMPLYNILKRYMECEEYKKIVSQSMLSLPALINEVSIYPNVIRERADFCEAPRIAFNLPENNLIELLKNFDPIDAISFYRNVINDTYCNLLVNREGEFLNEGLKEFVDLDIFLSPFTSYPVNNPIKLLFARPFERLYNDMYLIDAKDYYRFIQRAYIFYTNFGGILAQGMRYLIWDRDSHIENTIRDLDKPKEITDPEYWEEREYAKKIALSMI
jgi:DNA-binding MarR family transcriptional regulator